MPNRRAGKSVSWRRDALILERIGRVMRLHLRRVPNTQIATELGVDEATVRRDIERGNHLWQDHIKLDRDILTARIVAELDDTRERALAAAEWDQACERAVLFDQWEEPDILQALGDRRRPRIYRDKKGAAQFRGNKAAALTVARAATMDKAKLLGLVVDKVAPTNSQGDDLTLDDLMERFARARHPEGDAQ
jgi:hypothetical protein